MEVEVYEYFVIEGLGTPFTSKYSYARSMSGTRLSRAL